MNKENYGNILISTDNSVNKINKINKSKIDIISIDKLPTIILYEGDVDEELGYVIVNIDIKFDRTDLEMRLYRDGNVVEIFNSGRMIKDKVSLLNLPKNITYLLEIHKDNKPVFYNNKKINISKSIYVQGNKLPTKKFEAQDVRIVGISVSDIDGYGYPSPQEVDSNAITLSWTSASEYEYIKDFCGKIYKVNKNSVINKKFIYSVYKYESDINVPPQKFPLCKNSHKEWVLIGKSTDTKIDVKLKSNKNTAFYVGVEVE